MQFSILRTCLIAFIVIGFTLQATAQNTDTTYWKKKFEVGLNVNQASFSENWINGGVNSIGFNTYLLFKAKYLKGVHSWDNTIDVAYGIVKNEGQGSRKSVDYILLDTKYGHQISPHWNLFTSLTFQSQFGKGYKYDVENAQGMEYDSLISGFMSPAFLTSAWGAEYKPNDFFSLRLAPFAPRFTFVLNDDIARREVSPGMGPYGIDLGDNVRTEWLAFQLFAQFDKDIAKNLNLKWSYIMYMNYQNIEPKFWDHRLDLVLTAKVNNFMTVQLGGLLIYDRDQVDDIQLNQYLNLGVIFKMQNYKEEED